MRSRVLAAIVTLLLAQQAIAEADYRTVVIFGDTQELVDGVPGKDGELFPESPKDRENLNNLKRTIDWVIGNRKKENIDFVLHVGDMIQSGIHLPNKPLPQCYIEGVCQDDVVFTEKGRKCPCHYGRRAKVEWERFNWVWKRLDGMVPYAMVRGNHDNLGGYGDEGIRGFRDFYGAKQMSKLPGYVESSPLDDVGHVWKFRLGDHPVLVVGLPDGARWKSEQSDWANQVMDRPEHRELPTLLLAHRFFDGVPVDFAKPFKPWTSIVEKRPDRIFMTVWGHVSPGNIRMLSLGGKKVLDIQSNWQFFLDGPHASLVNLVRFKMGKDGIESVTIEAFTPALGFEKSATLFRTRLLTQPFVVPLRGAR